ncbi:MAG: ROK family protein, partial [Candidatus Zixiibacteriota bacterium]
MNVLGFDIGGAAIKVAPVNTTTGELVSETETIPLPNPPTPDAIADIIRKSIERLKWTSPIGIGYPGVIRNGYTHSAAHMGEQWLGFDFLTLLHEITDQPVGLINDADAAGLAEMQFGAGKDRNCAGGGTVLMLTFGTGIGSAFFHNGVLFPNTEFGHIEIEGAEAENRAA